MILASLLVLAAPPAPVARNVILMVADGCGHNGYQIGAMFEGRLGKEIFDGRGWTRLPMSTYPLRVEEKAAMTGVQDPNVVYDPVKAWNPNDDYAWLKSTPTDSGASATAYSTGDKTYKHSICWSDLGRPMRNANDRFHAIGKSVGVVTSVEWSDATPAAMIAHNRNRENRVEIAREMVERSGAEVILGVCHPWYDGDGVRRSNADSAEWVGQRPYFTTPIDTWNDARLIESKEDFEAFAAGKLDMRGRRRIVGTVRASGGLQINRKTRDWNGDGKIDGEDYKTAPVYGDPFNTTVPTLDTMATGALNYLARNPKGFFLMIEGGAIDTANHFNWPARSIEETLAFFRTVETVSKWVERHGGWQENLLIVTADHECGLILGPNSDKKPFDPIIDRGKGQRPGSRYNASGHSNMLIDVFARGVGAESLKKSATHRDPVRGVYIDNTDIGKLIALSAAE